MKEGGEEGEKPREICITRKIDWVSHIKDWVDRLSADVVGWSKHRREAFATTMLQALPCWSYQSEQDCLLHWGQR